MFLLQNSNLSVEEGKMRESLSSVNQCDIDFKKRPTLFYVKRTVILLTIVLRVARRHVECCHVLFTWN